MKKIVGRKRTPDKERAKLDSVIAHPGPLVPHDPCLRYCEPRLHVASPERRGFTCRNLDRRAPRTQANIDPLRALYSSNTAQRVGFIEQIVMSQKGSRTRMGC